MGNSEPTNSNLKIYIETEKLFYNSGSTIEGVVMVEAQKDFQMDALMLRVDGDEYCRWFEGSSINRRKFIGDSKFYLVQHLLCRYQSRILSSGSYAYPFSLELSQSIPGSYQSNNFDARIQYKLSAYFTNYGNKNATVLQSIPLSIREPFRRQVQTLEGHETFNHKKFWFTQQGQVGLQVYFQKNVCFQNDTIRIYGTVNNKKGQRAVQSIKIDLIQHTFVTANSGISRTYRNIISSHVVPIKAEPNRQQNFDHPFKIPNITHQTAIGTLVANYYRLQISVIYGWLSKNDSVIIAPLFIMKNNLKVESVKPKIRNLDDSLYKVQPTIIMKKQQYWYRRNKKLDLDLLNFQIQDKEKINY